MEDRGGLHSSGGSALYHPAYRGRTRIATNTNQKLAVLIDADNAQASVIQKLLSEVSRYGTATNKRAYNDWTTQNHKRWKDVLHKSAIQPMQQFSYTSGKNATDSTLIIDAIDVLHDITVGSFCTVSFNSAFTCVAMPNEREDTVANAFAERKGPEPFMAIAVNDSFIYTEILRTEPEEAKLGRNL